MTQTEALKLALEALEYTGLKWPQVEEAITAIKAALEAKDEPWTQDDMAYRPNGLPQEFIKHEVESLEDWSEWVCPDPDEYFMKCCDCGLVHEVQYRVARYGEGDYCELVEDKDVQAQFRMRRRTTLQQEKNDEKPWVCECGADSYNACKCVFKAALETKDDPWAPVSIGVDVTKDGAHVVGIYALDKDTSQIFYAKYHYAKDRHASQLKWVGLTDEEIWETISRIGTSDSDVNPYAKLADARAIEAKLKEKNT